MTSNEIIHAYDSSGKHIGVFIPSSLWEQLDLNVKSSLEKTNVTRPPLKEPIADWEMLTSCWDFPYPVDKDVHCSLCGNRTNDWQEDVPRKFRLKAANLGGLVSFECCECRARVRKNHFKDVIDVSCTPASS